MGAPKSYRKNRAITHKLENTGERRAGKLDADAGHMEHRDEVASLEEARRQRFFSKGIHPVDGHLILTEVDLEQAKELYFATMTAGESSKLNRLRKIILERQKHPSIAGRKLVNA